MTNTADEKDGRSIEIVVESRAPVDLVWRVLTEEQEQSNWFPMSAAVVKPGVGGTVTFSWGEDIAWQTRIAAFEPGKHLRWLDDAQAGPAPGAVRLAVDIYLNTREATTVLRLVHSGFGADDDWNEQFESTKAGWSFFLYNLRLYVEYHGRRTRRMLSRRLPIAGTRASVWERVLKSADGIVAQPADGIGIGRWVDVFLGPQQPREAAFA
jgi:uncharacterized protein YndB with AHSA1/START domain